MGSGDQIRCDVICLNKEKILEIRSALSTPEILRSQADVYKVLGHPVRLAILQVLKLDQCCVCDLANILDEPVSTISQHLKSLKSLGILSSKQIGKLVFYRIQENGHLLNWLNPMNSSIPQERTSIC